MNMGIRARLIGMLGVVTIMPLPVALLLIVALGGRYRIQSFGRMIQTGAAGYARQA